MSLRDRLHRSQGGARPAGGREARALGGGSGAARLASEPGGGMRIAAPGPIRRRPASPGAPHRLSRRCRDGCPTDTRQMPDAGFAP